MDQDVWADTIFLATGRKAALRIVSFHADNTNRGKVWCPAGSRSKICILRLPILLQIPNIQLSLNLRRPSCSRTALNIEVRQGKLHIDWDSQGKVVTLFFRSGL